MTNYNDGQWHGWNGGECPVHPETVIDALIVFSDGRPGFHQSVPARDLVWPWVESGQITAFRVVKEHREPREWWIGSDGMAYAEESISPEPRIHVVEKLK